MAVSLSIKDVPNDLARALRARAQSNHRSIQGELMDILETAVRPRPFKAMDLLRHARSLQIAAPDESTRMIRADRDRR